MNYAEFTNDQLWAMAEKMSEMLADDKYFEWRVYGKIDIVSRTRVNLDLSTDSDVMFKLINKVFEEENQAQDWLIAEWNKVAIDVCYNAITQYEEPPIGYTWEQIA